MKKEAAAAAVGALEVQNSEAAAAAAAAKFQAVRCFYIQIHYQALLNPIARA